MLRKFINLLKSRFPGFFQQVFRLRDTLFHISLRLKLSRLRKSETHFSMTYLSTNFPKPPALRSEFAHGGAVKLTYLAENFPHHFPSVNLLYAVSSVAHPMQNEIFETAKRKGLKIVVNQNGVAFPAWAGANYETTNRGLKRMIGFSDFIIYQSQFCKDSAERYISPPDVPNEIIYNPVDTRLFTPDDCSKKPDNLTLLLGGNQYEKYRLELALQTLKSLHSQVPDAKLIVTGKLWLPYDESRKWTDKVLLEMDLVNQVTFTGTYTQSEAPLIFSKAHILLHTKYADPSPGLILEALACGLPVVYVGNGGVPELVQEAGMGVPVEHSWDTINLPEPGKLVDAVLQVYSRCQEYSEIARQRVLEKFSLEKFVERHAEIFAKVLDS